MSSKNAYATLVMLDPKYIVGAVVLAQSLKKTKTTYDIICMVTPDIYENKFCKDILFKYFADVVLVEIVQFKTKPFLDKRKHTHNWINKSFTKLSAILLDQYDKVCILDTDQIVTNNIDHLFELQAPVGVFSNHWFDHVKPGGRKTGNFYSNIKPLDSISPAIIHGALHNNGFVASGNLLILNTSRKEFKEMTDILKKLQPFGFNCSSGADEQIICHYQSVIKKKNWTCLKHGYNVIPWKMKETLLPGQNPYILHFNMYPKPWNTPRGKWADHEIFWEYVSDIHDIVNICNNLGIIYSG